MQLFEKFKMEILKMVNEIQNPYIFNKVQQKIKKHFNLEKRLLLNFQIFDLILIQNLIMSVEGEVDLDALIEKDKKQAKVRKTKQIQKQRQYRKQHRKRNQEDFRKRANEHHRRDRNRQPRQFQPSKQQEKTKLKNNPPSYYAIKITGLLSDVSVDDICKLLGDRKIISIKTILRNKNLTPVDSSNVSLMDVIVVLSDKDQTDSFVKSYSERKLDGKYQLAFTFINARDQLE